MGTDSSGFGWRGLAQGPVDASSNPPPRSTDARSRRLNVDPPTCEFLVVHDQVHHAKGFVRPTSRLRGRARVKEGSDTGTRGGHVGERRTAGLSRRVLGHQSRSGGRLDGSYWNFREVLREIYCAPRKAPGALPLAEAPSSGEILHYVLADTGGCRYGAESRTPEPDVCTLPLERPQRGGSVHGRRRPATDRGFAARAGQRRGEGREPLSLMVSCRSGSGAGPSILLSVRRGEKEIP